MLKNVSTVLRRVGAFEDYYIPRVDGETPLDFETISGMDVNLDDDFNNFLLKSIVSGMGVPSSFIESGNELEYSRELIMQNSSFIREIVAMQIDAEQFLGDVFRQAFIYEYYDELGYETKNNGKTVKKPTGKRRKKDLAIDVSKIKVELPVPEFLNVSSTMEQIQNYTSQVEFVVQTVYPDELVNMDESMAKERAIFKQKYTKSLIKSIDWAEIDNIIKETKIELTGQKLEDNANKDLDDAMNGGGDDNDLGGMGGDMGDDMM